MAALGKIRSKGKILIGVIGFALFAFVAGDLVKGCESSNNARKQKLAEINGESVNALDYQKYVEEYVEASKTEIALQQSMGMAAQTPTDEQIREKAWQDFVNAKMIETETSELGLMVTDEEIQNVIQQGIHQFLGSIAIPQFHNAKTGRFDANALKQFLNSYKQAQQSNPQMAEQMAPAYKYWMFKEKQLRQALLTQKYMVLLQESVLSNPVEAKLNFNGRQQESDIQLAYIDYKSINDNQVKIEEADLQKKYDEVKERFAIGQEIREIKYVSVQKVASAADRKELQTKMKAFAAELQSAANAEQVVRKSQSLVPYAGVAAAKSVYPNDVAAKLDSMAVGSVSAMFETPQDNTLNVVKLISKTSMPDSIQYRMLSVMGKTPTETKTKSDSVLAALQDGADFEAVAKKYGQTGEKAWLTGMQQYQTALQAKDNMPIINALNEATLNEYKMVNVSQATVIVQVLERKAMQERYDVAVIKKSIDFSDETSQAIYNKFTTFVAANRDIASMEKNAAKAGYRVQEFPGVTTSAGSVAGIAGTREALKWIFEANEGDMSEVFKCGNNDQLLVVALTKIYPKGYLPLSHPQVKEMVKQEVLKDKKAEMLVAKLEGVKNMAAARQKGCKTTEVKQITFGAPAVVQAVMASEPALSGAVAATAQGKFVSHPVKGNAGVYLFQVTAKRTLPGKFDARQEAQQAAMSDLNNLFQMLQFDLQRKAQVIDNRYLFM